MENTDVKQTLVVAPCYQDYKHWTNACSLIAGRNLRREYRYVSIDRDLWGWHPDNIRIVVLWYPSQVVSAERRRVSEEVDRLQSQGTETRYIRI